MDDDMLLKTSIHELCTYFAETCRITIPVLQRDKIAIDQRETQIDVSNDRNRYIQDRSRPFLVVGTLVEVYIPFSGDPQCFNVQPSTFTFHPPRGDVRDNMLVLYIEGVDLVADIVRAQIQQLITDVLQNLRYLQTDAERFNGNLISYAYALVEQRRRKLLTDRALVSSLDIKLKERTNDSPFLPAPTLRRRVMPTFAPGRTPQTEPTLDPQDFEQILELLHTTVAILSHSPTAIAYMSEETLRSHFLIRLNDKFVGDGASETFHFEDESDIFIRTENKNIFIAECKFWSGPLTLLETLDQIVGSPCWRDTKVVLIILNRNKPFAHLLGVLYEAIKSHSNFKRQLPQLEETIFPCVLAQREDRTREMYLTVLAFDLSSPASP